MGQASLKYDDRGTGPPGVREPDPGGADRDVALMARVRDGNECAFATLVSIHFRVVFALSRRMLGDDGEAEDIAQEVFLKVWKRAGAWQAEKARFTTWLHRVTANACIDRLRKRIPTPVETIPDRPDPDAGPELDIARDQVAARVEAAISLLPERQRLALVLTYYQGLSNREAAAVMEITVDALESLLARARRGLKRQLKGEARELLMTLEE